jgi:hypothetical protein
MYFPATRWTPFGPEAFQGSTIIGWRIAYRAYHDANQPHRLLRLTCDTPSRFGALRALIAKCRSWHGKVFVLDIESITPIYTARYELIEN